MAANCKQKDQPSKSDTKRMQYTAKEPQKKSKRGRRREHPRKEDELESNVTKKYERKNVTLADINRGTGRVTAKTTNYIPEISIADTSRLSGKNQKLDENETRILEKGLIQEQEGQTGASRQLCLNLSKKKDSHVLSQMNFPNQKNNECSHEFYKVSNGSEHVKSDISDICPKYKAKMISYKKSVETDGNRLHSIEVLLRPNAERSKKGGNILQADDDNNLKKLVVEKNSMSHIVGHEEKKSQQVNCSSSNTKSCNQRSFTEVLKKLDLISDEQLPDHDYKSINRQYAPIRHNIKIEPKQSLSSHEMIGTELFDTQNHCYDEFERSQKQKKNHKELSKENSYNREESLTATKFEEPIYSKIIKKNIMAEIPSDKKSQVHSTRLPNTTNQIAKKMNSAYVDTANKTETKRKVVFSDVIEYCLPTTEGSLVLSQKKREGQEHRDNHKYTESISEVNNLSGPKAKDPLSLFYFMTNQKSLPLNGAEKTSAFEDENIQNLSPSHTTASSSQLNATRQTGFTENVEKNNFVNQTINKNTNTTQTSYKHNHRKPYTPLTPRVKSILKLEGKPLYVPEDKINNQTICNSNKYLKNVREKNQSDSVKLLSELTHKLGFDSPKNEFSPFREEELEFYDNIWPCDLDYEQHMLRTRKMSEQSKYFRDGPLHFDGTYQNPNSLDSTDSKFSVPNIPILSTVNTEINDNQPRASINEVFAEPIKAVSTYIDTNPSHQQRISNADVRTQKSIEQPESSRESELLGLSELDKEIKMLEDLISSFDDYKNFVTFFDPKKTNHSKSKINLRRSTAV